METKDYVIAVIIIGIALSAGLLSAWQYMNGVKSDRQNEKLQEELSVSQKMVLEKQEEINYLQGETLKRVMGFGYIRVNAYWLNSKEFGLSVESKSEYPIYESEMTIFNQDEIDKCPKKTIDGKTRIMSSCLYSKSITIDMGTVHSGKIRKIEVPFTFDKKTTRLFFRISNKHNTLIQFSIIENDSNRKKFKHSYRVFSAVHNEYQLLESDNYDVGEDVFENAFPNYKKDLIVFED